MGILPCWEHYKREWWAYPLDVLTLGGYRLYQTHQFSNCLSNTKPEDYRKLLEIVGLKEGQEGRKV